MTSLLLLIIYLAFISLGLPDALLGSAWPVMHQELGASVSWAGIVSMIISGGTIVSSLASDRLTRKLGAGRVTAFSVLMTAAALFGFSVSHSFWMLCLWAIPYGLGAGSVDAALNNFVALHYPARHMSWLHCMWGVGASIGPVIMGWAITGGLRWNGGYQSIAGIQMVLTLILFLSLPLWKKMPSPFSHTSVQTDPSNPADRQIRMPEDGTSDNVTSEDPGEPVSQEPPTLSQILRKRGVREVLVSFFCYCAIETTAGMWASSYCTLNRGISAEQAAQWASLFYIGITAGRFVCGFITMKLSDRNMIRLGQILAALGLILAMLPLGDHVLLAALILIGCGCAPVYPSLIHETPSNFGAALSQSIIGVQMAFAYIGSCLVPPLFGLLAQYVDIALYPFFLAVLLVLMIIMTEALHRKVRRA